jgi:hypothetical protein
VALVVAALLFGCEEDGAQPAKDTREAGAVDASPNGGAQPERPGEESRPTHETDAQVMPRPTSDREGPPPDGGSLPAPRSEAGASSIVPLRPNDAGRSPLDEPPDGGVDGSASLGPLDCSASAPSLAFDRVALVEGNRLVLRGFATGEEVVGATWSDAFVPSIAVSFSSESGELRFAVALSNGTSCRVEAVGGSGEPLWATELPARACVAPTPLAGGLWLPLESMDGTGSVELLSASDGARLAATGLPSPPKTSLAALGGGGSHWIGGSEEGLYVIESNGSDVGVWAHATPELGGVSRLAVYAEDRVGAASGTALGRYRVDVSSRTVDVIGEPIVTPGPVTSNLVASVDCGDRAGGATHFFCDAGILAAGGESWLTAWRLDDGQPWFDVSVDETLHGLALLGDGRLLGGGSHWLDRDGRVRLYSISGPNAPIEVIHTSQATEPSCVGSPVVDTDGQLGLAVSSRSTSAFLTMKTSAPGLASGWSRDGGDNPTRASGANADASCEQGSERLFEKFVGPELVRAAAVITLPDGGFVVAGVGSTGVLAGFSAGGTQGWSHALTPPGPAIAALTSSSERLFGFALDADDVRVVVLTSDGGVVAERIENVPGLAALIGAHTLPDGNLLLVATRTLPDAALPEPALSDATLLVFDTSGTLLDTTEMVDSTTLVPIASALAPGTNELLLTGVQSYTGAFVTRVALDGSVTWFDSVLGARADLRGVAVVASADGTATVAFANGPHTLLQRYDAFGERVLSTPTSFVVPAALGSGVAGTWLLDQSGGVHRVLDQLTLVPLRPAPTEEPLTGVDLVPTGAGALVVADVARADGSTGVLVAHLDEEARSGCASAGLCVTLVDCPSEGRCGAGHCEPSTGECSTQPAPDLNSCGSNDVCYAGSCGPVPPEIDAPRTLEASSCFDVASYAECVPYALSYATLVLHEDGTIESSDPNATGVWREPSGPGTIEFVFRDSRTGEVLSTFTGELVFDRCWEGTVEAAAVAPGAFRACQT